MAGATRTDTTFSEFIYTIARDAPMSLKRRLPFRFFKAINSDKSAMRFAAKSSYEDKRRFLAYLGVEQFIIFADVNKMSGGEIRDLFKKVEGVSPESAVLKQLAGENVYVSSNREFCYSLLNFSSLFNTPVYVQSLELIRSGYNVNKWSNKIDGKDQQDNLEEKEAQRKFAKFIYSVLWADDTCEMTTGVDSPTVRVLIYLYLTKGYVTKEKICGSIGLTTRQVFMSIKRCTELMFIQKHPIKETKEYQITGTGILAINKYLEKIMKSLEFNP